jgi:predicted CoA-binding protein
MEEGVVNEKAAARLREVRWVVMDRCTLRYHPN